MKFRGSWLLKSFIWLAVILNACVGRSSQPAPVPSTPIAQPTLHIREIQPEPATPTVENSATEAVLAGEPDDEGQVAAPAQVEGLGSALENNRPLAARVNNQPLFLETYDKQVAQMAQAMQAQAVDLTTEAGQEALNQVRRQVLEALIDQLIIEQQADKLGLTITEETLETRAQELIAQEQNQAQFELWLTANNLTYQEFKKTLKSQLIANRLFEHITGHAPKTAEQIKVRHIEVADEATAWSIIEQLKNGADFAALAQAQSLADSSRANGGDLGWFSRGMAPIPPEVETVAFSLQPGQVSGPIRPALGFHIIKLEDREAERPLTNEMLQAIKKQIFTGWLAEQRALTVIERFVAL